MGVSHGMKLGPKYHFTLTLSLSNSGRWFLLFELNRKNSNPSSSDIRLCTALELGPADQSIHPLHYDEIGKWNVSQLHGCQMAIARFLDGMCLALWAWRTMAPLRYAAKFDPFLSLDCAPMPSTLARSKERKGSNFAIWQSWSVNRRTTLARSLTDQENNRSKSSNEPINVGRKT